MCVLVLLHRTVAGFPIVVGANRDEARARPASPPGLLEAGRRRALAPRDRRSQGTWLGFNDRGVFAALTNRPGDVNTERPSRGEIVPLALTAESAAGAMEAVEKRIARGIDNPFRIVVADGVDAFATANDGTAAQRLVPGMHWLSNEHGLDPFDVPSLGPLKRVKEKSVAEDALRQVLRDHAVHGGNHCFCKHGDERGTVSSSIVSIPDADPFGAEFWFANGQPCVSEYKRYSNLTSRLRAPDAG